jgi:hypothetical protein
MERLAIVHCTDAGVIYEWWADNVGLVKWEELNFWAGLGEEQCWTALLQRCLKDRVCICSLVHQEVAKFV